MYYTPSTVPDSIEDKTQLHKYFDSEFTQESIENSYDHRKMRPSIEEKTQFEGFDFN